MRRPPATAAYTFTQNGFGSNWQNCEKAIGIEKE
jgi:hypothetical protein